MFKKILYFTLIFSILFAIIAPLNASAATTEKVIFDKNLVINGAVGVKYQGDSNSLLKVKVYNESTNKTLYYTLAVGETEYFPLQLGDGSYKITVFKNVLGNTYKSVASDTLEFKSKDQKLIYLNSIQIIDWNQDMGIIKKAQKLTVNASTDLDKAKAIYRYIITSYSYDYKKAASVTGNYVPDIEKTDVDKKGICYDYSSVYAAMLRSVGVPTKLVKGYTSNFDGYHAWNEVYIEGKGWITVDTTADTFYRQKNMPYAMAKDTNKYSGSCYY